MGDVGWQIEQDVPCVQCGYNLRGLKHDSHCPECGIAIGLAIDAFDEHRSVERELFVSADRRWVQGIIEGMALLAISLVIAIVAPCLPFDLSVRRQRELSVAFAATYWVLTWVGVWKLARPEPGGASARFPRPLAVSLRICATLYAALPFVASSGLTLPAIICAFAVAPTSILLWEVVRRHAMRLPSMMIVVQARVLAFVMPFVSLFGLLRDVNDRQVPVTVFGTVGLLQHGLRYGVSDFFTSPLILFLLVPTLVASLIPFEFLIAWLFRRRARRVNVEDVRGKTAASSHP